MSEFADFLLARFAEDEEEWQSFRWDPEVRLPVSLRERLLAECEAKRRIVELADRDDNWRYGMHSEAIDTVLRLLAAPYADHPDYRDEWRP